MAIASTRFGRYELVTAIGRGGMAELYLGRLLGIGGFAKPVAIKRILPHLTEDPRFVEMFLNEGRIAARLSHPNVCQVFELGEVDGQLFLAMEYLEGVPWSDLLSSTPREPEALVQLAAHVIGQACDGLAYAHELRGSDGKSTPVVHRDVSPGNLYVTVDGVCKILDFGVSKFVTDVHDTRSGLIKGKLMYMPPEQMRSQHVDARVDVFAAGIVLWEALAGRRLFARDTDYLIFQAILEDPIPPLAELDTAFARFDSALDRVIGRALERDREQRYPTIRVFADELRAVAARFGPAISASEVGSFVRTRFGDRLADRARKVAAVSALYDHADTEVSPAAPMATAATAQLRRGGSVPLGRTTRRNGWIYAAVTAALLVGAGAIVWRMGNAVDVPVLNSDASARSVEGRVMADAARDETTVGTRPPRDSGSGSSSPAVPPPPSSSQASPPLRASASRPRTHREPVANKSGEPIATKPADLVATKPGYYSVDSKPFAMIFIDGQLQDHTPVFHFALQPGKHQIRAVLADGRERAFAVLIESGKDLSSNTLSW
ncbi:MAG TPA: serine/threonine-protein kinase [Kofleriaceae bacterium]|nr:serine/threonine-protein kinase [Kofleriaceae bacterium]